MMVIMGSGGEHEGRKSCSVSKNNRSTISPLSLKSHLN